MRATKHASDAQNAGDATAPPLLCLPLLCLLLLLCLPPLRRRLPRTSDRSLQPAPATTDPDWSTPRTVIHPYQRVRHAKDKHARDDCLHAESSRETPAPLRLSPALVTQLTRA